MTGNCIAHFRLGFWRSLSIPLAMLALTFSVQGALILEDHFLTGSQPANGQYATGDIAGQNPTISGASGAWIANSSGSANAQSSGFSYSGFSSSGGSVAMVGSERTGRLLSSTYGNSSATTVYVSFLIQLESTSTGYRAFEMHSGGFEDAAHRRLQLGLSLNDFGNNNFGLRLFNDNSFRMDFGAADTAVNLFVLKFVFGTPNDADSLTVWRNPTSLGGNEPSGGTTRSGFNLQLDRFTLAQFGVDAANEVGFDEIRFGTTFGDVTPVPEPINVALGMFGFGFVLIAGFRHFKKASFLKQKLL